MHRVFKQESKDKFIREACAVAEYHHPEDKDFQKNLINLLNESESVSWLLTCKLLQHMVNYHRIKLFKYYPELMPDINLFNLMLAAFIPDQDVAEFALARVPQLRSRAEYHTLLTAIPDRDVEQFQLQAEKKMDSNLLSQVKENNDISRLTAFMPERLLLTTSAALLYYTQCYTLTVPVLWMLYNTLNGCIRSTLPAEKIKEKSFAYTSLFASPPKLNSRLCERPPSHYVLRRDK